MKPRSLLTLTPIALLWVRQLRFERRLSRRQGMYERETLHSLGHFAQGVRDTIDHGAKSWNEWGDELVRKVEGAVRR